MRDDTANPSVAYRCIVTWTGEDVLNVRTSAIFRRDVSWTVFVVENDRAVRQRIEIGPRSAGAVKVPGGLSEGERVILYPSAEIRRWVRVR